MLFTLHKWLYWSDQINLLLQFIVQIKSSKNVETMTWHNFYCSLYMTSIQGSHNVSVCPFIFYRSFQFVSVLACKEQLGNIIPIHRLHCNRRSYYHDQPYLEYSGWQIQIKTAMHYKGKFCYQSCKVIILILQKKSFKVFPSFFFLCSGTHFLKLVQGLP